MDRIRQSFLERQLQDGLLLASQSDLFKLIPIESPFGPPELYRVQYLCKGLVIQPDQQIVEAQEFEVGIRFKENHLREPFDPTTVTLLWPHNLWHPNSIGPALCVGKMPMGAQLKDLIHQIYEILTYQNWASHDGLNPDAMQWARNNQALFPVDRRPLKRRVLKLQTQPIAAAQPTEPAANTATLSTEPKL